MYLVTSRTLLLFLMRFLTDFNYNYLFLEIIFFKDNRQYCATSTLYTRTIYVPHRYQVPTQYLLNNAFLEQKIKYPFLVVIENWKKKFVRKPCSCIMLFKPLKFSVCHINFLTLLWSRNTYSYSQQSYISETILYLDKGFFKTFAGTACIVRVVGKLENFNIKECLKCTYNTILFKIHLYVS